MFNDSTQAQSSESGTSLNDVTGVTVTSSPVRNQIFTENVTTPTKQHLVVVDAAASNFSPLIDSLGPSQVVLLDTQKDGVTQISEALLQHINAPLKSIHIVSKGNRGLLQVGNTLLSENSLSRYTSELTQWSESLTDDADILLYGSNIGKGSEGQTFISKLASLTDADVAASDDLSRRLSDWNLEKTTGTVKTPSVLEDFSSDAFKGNLTLPKGSVPAPLLDTSAFSRTIPAGYSGYNVNATIIDWQNSNLTNQLAAATEEISGDGSAATRTLRLSGGSVANYWDWETGGVTQAKLSLFETNASFQGIAIPPAVRVSQGATIPRLNTFLNRADAGSVWVVNMLTSSLEREIKAIRQAIASGVFIKGIELGNEFYLNLGSYNGKASKSKEFKGFENADDYATTAKAWAQAIKEKVSSDIPIALTAAPNNKSNPRSQGWNTALMKKRGPNQKSAVDVADAITLHPYYQASDLGVTTADIGNTQRAGQIARKSTAQLRSILSGDMNTSQAGLQLTGGINDSRLKNEALWITEHNILEQNKKEKSDRTVLGNSWLHSLMVDLNTHEFLKDTRTQLSLAHMLVGTPQWQALTVPGRKEIDGNQRGQFNPFKESNAKNITKTATGFVLGKSAEILNNGGQGTLLKSGPAFTAWQIENISNRTHEISAVNAGDRNESFKLPELPQNERWQVSLFTTAPWDTPNVKTDLTPKNVTLRGNSTLTVPPFTKVVATSLQQAQNQ